MKLINRSEADTIRASFRLPPKTKAFVAAETAWQEAVATTNAARSRQKALTDELSPIMDGADARALRARIDEATGNLAELSAVERKAKTELDRLRSEHAAACRKAVQPVADRFAAATIAAIDAVADLLRVGAELDERLRAEDVDLAIPELAAAPAASRLLAQYVAGQLKRWRA